MRLGKFICLCGFAFLPSTASFSCQYDPERTLVDAILNQDRERFDVVAGATSGSTMRIPSVEFYSALFTWYQGYQTNNKKQKFKGIDQLRKAVSRIREGFADEHSAKNLLASGLMHGHFARILLDSERLLEGYRNGMLARQQIRRYLELASADAWGQPDAGMLAGLYEVYTHDLQNRFHWLIGTIDYRGDRDLGISLLEKALEGQGAFATEALRALLGEVSWRLPDFCRYIEVAETRAKALERNRDLAVLAVGLLIRCGRPERAAGLAAWYSSRNPEPAVDSELDRARLRIHADRGDLAALDAIKPEDTDPHYLMARANALDVTGQRDEALAIYAQLAERDDIESVFRDVSRVRQRYPYEPPKPREVSQFEVGDCGLDLAEGPGVR